ncbi:hypothetical protein [Bosea sp. NBC_00550]|uniref:hypothetical protein n=1 Tax=Bosea sp. NBC_00550 TaxID=2969621 RepID=UPI00222F8CAE|nr:hypothetical protein [Bosea sp. NBC_00550]UZF93019.1 hypothetical protein NWE53_02035 [Bosea sp. NBC_00550]
MKRLLIAAALAACASSASAAQTLIWECEFKGKDELKLKYTFDVGTKTAFVSGKNGVEEVYRNMGHEAQLVLSFIEFVPSGEVHTTTIILDTKEAIHSRHTVIPNGLSGFTPSQMLGKCVLLP